jgi:hypothetical protein
MCEENGQPVCIVALWNIEKQADNGVMAQQWREMASAPWISMANGGGDNNING